MSAVLPRKEVEELVKGLRRDEKMISPKYFYDHRGSQLFDQITRLPEYYPTQTELGIMSDNIDEIAGAIGKQASLIEFGSGTPKTSLITTNFSSTTLPTNWRPTCQSTYPRTIYWPPRENARPNSPT